MDFGQGKQINNSFLSSIDRQTSRICFYQNEKCIKKNIHACPSINLDVTKGIMKTVEHLLSEYREKSRQLRSFELYQEMK